MRTEPTEAEVFDVPSSPLKPCQYYDCGNLTKLLDPSGYFPCCTICQRPAREDLREWEDAGLA